MSLLPSPPHNPLSPEPAPAHRYPRPHIDSNMKTLLASSWRVMEQPPPPTLREILEAYKARGDGDREMLLAMLNAKSSEDQRVASLASLHRTMLDIYQAPHVPAIPPPVPPLHVPDSHHSHSYSHSHHFPSPPASYHHSPHAPAPPQLHYEHAHHAHQRTSSSSSTVDLSRDRMPSSSSQQTRKRRRTSRSPPPHPRTRASPSQEAMHAHAHDLPPSPYSSASSAQSSSDSPRSRESMAINSLLLNSHSAIGDDVTPKRNTSSERSTTLASQER
ncbi:hypothetical protein C8Q76DRAFT_712381 [Earliella scabrosa]|nr:hypothetical protein C8Q76DRAFT_712381 [Earliella scabrosa]